MKFELEIDLQPMQVQKLREALENFCHDNFIPQPVLRQTDVSGALPPSLHYLKALVPKAKTELEICLTELGHEPPILNRLVSKLEDFIGGNDR